MNVQIGIALLCLIQTVYGNQACEKFIQCKLEFRNQAQACNAFRKSNATVNATKPETNSSQCMDAIQAIKRPIVDLNNARLDQMVGCIGRNKDLNTMSYPLGKVTQCEKISGSSIPKARLFALTDEEDKKENRRKKLECKKMLSKFKKTCGKFAGCCPGKELCNLEFEVSELHDNIRKIEKIAYLKEIDCPPKHQRDKNEMVNEKKKINGKGKAKYNVRGKWNKIKNSQGKRKWKGKGKGGKANWGKEKQGKGNGRTGNGAGDNSMNDDHVMDFSENNKLA